MSSETDHPRQRTVAELLAEHGESGATGRRRRRRAPDEPDEGGHDAPPGRRPSGYGSAPPVERRPEPLAYREPATEHQEPAYGEPDRSVLREPVPPAPRVTPEDSWNMPPAPPVFPASAEPPRERQTDVMPRISAPVKEDRTGPLPEQEPSQEELAQQESAQQESAQQDTSEDDAGPSTMIGGAPVEAQDWHRARTDDARRDGAAIDGGPSLPPGPVDAAAEPAGLGAPVDVEKHDKNYEDEPDEAPKPRERRLGRAAAAAKAGTIKGAAAPAWAAVLVQWIAGALGGAVLWVLFRFLWRNLPVVALASAVVVTVGLVIVVRALLHNNDRRTTIFAVLVGLLLTVSPVILVLMGR